MEGYDIIPIAVQPMAESSEGTEKSLDNAEPHILKQQPK